MPAFNQLMKGSLNLAVNTREADTFGTAYFPTSLGLRVGGFFAQALDPFTGHAQAFPASALRSE